jgi:hypothetical protein
MAKIAKLDIVKHNGEVYVKEARKAEVGEKIIVVNDGNNTGAYDRRFFRKGNIGIATSVNHANFSNCGNYYVYGNGRWSINPEAYNVLVPLKPGVKVTVDGVEYEVSDREARAGEKVIIVDEECCEGYYVNGDILVIDLLDEDGDACIKVPDDDDDEYYVSKDEYLTLIPVAKSNENITKEGEDMTDIIVHEGVEYRKVDRAVREGDKYIVCTTNEYAFFTKGKVYPVTGVAEDGDALTTDDDGDIDMNLTSDEYAVLELIAPVSIDERIADIERQLTELKAERAKQQTEEVAKQERLKVGEYAVVIANNNRHKFPIGNVVVVKTVDDDGEPNRCDSIDGSDYWYLDSTELRRATPEEVAKAKRKLAEEAKWAAIGRKVGEFKAGDVVRFKEDTGASEYPEGSLAILDRVYGGYADFDGFGAVLDWLELVVPVEQRFDR